MYAITGITGKVGGAVARALLGAGRPVRAVVRSLEKGKAWADQGCDVAVADMEDSRALRAAFSGAEAVFVLPPPDFDPSPGFPETKLVIAAVVEALAAAQPKRVVCLSTVGAQVERPNLLSERTLIEQALTALPLPLTLLRPAWFMDNISWDIAQARATGTIDSFLQPLDRAIPMVSTADIGTVAAELLQQSGSGRRVVELEGPHRVSPLEIASTLSALLRRQVQARTVLRDTWFDLFKAQGMRNLLPRIQMLDGINEGWLDFEGAPQTVLKGTVDLAAALSALV